jgi:hypothetical protein
MPSRRPLGSPEAQRLGGSAVSGARPSLVRIGEVLRIPEAHYLYGSGELVLRVTHVDPNLDRYPRLEWVRVRGIEVCWDGSDGQPREVMIRVAVLRDPRSRQS